MNELRDENGVMLAKLQPQLTNEILNNCQGHVTQKNLSISGKVNVFVFDDDQAFSAQFLKIFLWKGSYIIL